VTYAAAAAAHPGESRNVGELAGEVGRLAVLAGQAGQARGGVVQAGDGLVELAARPSGSVAQDTTRAAWPGTAPPLALKTILRVAELWSAACHQSQAGVMVPGQSR
jgi:hypothetical protein